MTLATCGRCGWDYTVTGRYSITHMPRYFRNQKKPASQDTIRAVRSALIRDGALVGLYDNAEVACRAPAIDERSEQGIVRLSVGWRAECVMERRTQQDATQRRPSDAQLSSARLLHLFCSEKRAAPALEPAGVPATNRRRSGALHVTVDRRDVLAPARRNRLTVA